MALLYFSKSVDEILKSDSEAALTFESAVDYELKV